MGRRLLLDVLDGSGNSDELHWQRDVIKEETRMAAEPGVELRKK